MNAFPTADRAMPSKHDLRRLILAFACAALTSNAHAAESVFGLTFGEQIHPTPCSGHERFPFHPREGYCLTPSSQRNLSSGENGVNGLVTALFNHNDLPFWTSDQLDLVLVDGKLAGIIAKTGGRTTHMSVTADLVKRFGQPTGVIQRSAQNQLGATFDNSLSMWKVGDLVVTYTPMVGDIKTGQVDLFTPAGLELYQKLLSEKTPTPARPL